MHGVGVAPDVSTGPEPHESDTVLLARYGSDDVGHIGATIQCLRGGEFAAEAALFRPVSAWRPQRYGLPCAVVIRPLVHTPPRFVDLREVRQESLSIELETETSRDRMELEQIADGNHRGYACA